MTEEHNTNPLPNGETGKPQQEDPSPGRSKVEAMASRSPGNEQSTIEFPYHDLASAEMIVRAVFDNAGDACSLDQLAAYLKQSMTSGAFRLRVSNARLFGLTENERGEVRLTDLAKRLVDPGQESEARAEAFLRVPLYARIYENYKGYTLPPAAGLEKFMAEVGVSYRQTNKARQAFVRSARQAGFFAQGEDRLVRPASRPGPGTAPITPPPADPKHGGDGGRGGGGGDDDLHQAIQGVLRTLPPAGTEWPLRKRAKCLSALNNIFDLIYEAGEDGDIEITVKHINANSDLQTH